MDKFYSSMGVAMYDQLSNLNGIRVFEAAARRESFKMAAEELHLTPTAVSHQIRNLETQLGIALFERRTRAVQLTDAGRQLADAARRSLQILADAIDEISTRQKNLTINTTASFAALWLVPRLGDFQKRHPDLNVVIQADEQLVNLKRDRRVDIAIRYGRVPSDTGAELLLREEFGLYGTAGLISQLDKTGPVTMVETQWKNSQLPTVTAEQWLRSYKPGWKKVVQQRYDQEIHVIQAAMAGRGLALVSNLLAESTVRQGWLQPYQMECRLPGFGYYLLIDDQRGRPRKVELFRSWLLSQLPGSSLSTDGAAPS